MEERKDGERESAEKERDELRESELEKLAGGTGGAPPSEENNWTQMTNPTVNVKGDPL